MRILLIGRGRMGRLIEELALAEGHTVNCVSGRADLGLFAAETSADVAVDVSHPDMLSDVLAYVARTKTPLCCGVTGYSESQMNDLTELAKTVPILYSANFSLGIAVFRRVLSEISPLFADDFDVEMVEVHHNQKADAPSGTAKLLADAIDPDGRLERVYGRSGMCGRRPKKEMGMFSMRGGTVSGTHTVSFFGEDESFTLTHSAASRRIFAKGALRAAEALAESRAAGAGKATGLRLFSLEDILFPQSE